MGVAEQNEPSMSMQILFQTELCNGTPHTMKIIQNNF